jgi:hypothetical protein
MDNLDFLQSILIKRENWIKAKVADWDDGCIEHSIHPIDFNTSKTQNFCSQWLFKYFT